MGVEMFKVAAGVYSMLDTKTGVGLASFEGGFELNSFAPVGLVDLSNSFACFRHETVTNKIVATTRPEAIFIFLLLTKLI